MSDKTVKLTQAEREKSSAIMLSINLESAFKLYSYRIISHEQFVSQTKELVSLFTKNIEQDV